jgi:hypothetical protein
MKLNRQKTDFYVYAYLDPRKPIVFDNLFSFEPFYIGLGRENRIDHHLQSAYKHKDSNKLKANKICKIKRETGVDAFRIKIKTDLSFVDASKLEIQLIKSIGRIDLKTGPLTNLTDGGDGIHNLSDKSLRKLKRNRKGKGAGEKNGMYGRKHTQEAKDKVSNANKGRVLSKSHKRKLSRASSGENNGMFGKKHSLESKQKITKSLEGKKFSEEVKKNISARTKGKGNSFFGKVHTEKSKQKISDTKKNNPKLYEKKCIKCNNLFVAKAHNAKRCLSCQ